MSQKRSTKLPLIIGGVILALLVIGGLVWGLSPANNGAAGPTPVPTLPPEPVNVIPIEERAYGRIIPTADGRTLTVSLEKVNKEANEAEYEIEYQTGTVLQGAGGSLDPSDLPATEDVLLGSCSAGGKCSYHEGVTGGQLTLRFEDPNRYAVRGEWSFWNNATGKETTISSRDGKLGITGTGLAKTKYGVVFQSPGYPDELPGRAVSQIYALGVSTAPTGSLKVSLRLTEDAANAKLAVWDGTAWKSVTGTVADKTLTATLTAWPQALIAVVEE
jgi:hypothetical protein